MTSLSPVQPRQLCGKVAPKIELFERLRVHGKCFYRGSEKLHLKGVTYGPFAPNTQGVQFPASDVVRYDFMHSAPSRFQCGPYIYRSTALAV